MLKVHIIEEKRNTHESISHSVVNNLPDKIMVVDEVTDADLVFMDMGCRDGWYSGTDVYDAVDKKIPFVFFDTWFYGGMSNDKPPHLNYELKIGLNMVKMAAINHIFFIRDAEKNAIPQNAFPINRVFQDNYAYPVLNPSDIESRPYDLCFVGKLSTQRANLITGLMKYKTLHVNCEFTSSLSESEWIERHKCAKLFIEADGRGFGSERPFKLSFIAPQLRQINNQIRVNDFVNMEDCVEVNEHPTDKDVENILSVLNDADKLYHLYLNGIKKLKEHYSENKRAEYVMSIIEKQFSFDGK